MRIFLISIYIFCLILSLPSQAKVKYSEIVENIRQNNCLSAIGNIIIYKRENELLLAKYSDFSNQLDAQYSACIDKLNLKDVDIPATLNTVDIRAKIQQLQRLSQLGQTIEIH